jgi:hypothetical protein
LVPVTLTGGADRDDWRARGSACTGQTRTLGPCTGRQRQSAGARYARARQKLHVDNALPVDNQGRCASRADEAEVSTCHRARRRLIEGQRLRPGVGQKRAFRDRHADRDGLKIQTRRRRQGAGQRICARAHQSRSQRSRAGTNTQGTVCRRHGRWRKGHANGAIGADRQ